MSSSGKPSRGERALTWALYFTAFAAWATGTVTRPSVWLDISVGILAGLLVNERLKPQ